LASEIQLINRRKLLDVRYKGLEEVHIFIRLPRSKESFLVSISSSSFSEFIGPLVGCHLHFLDAADGIVIASIGPVTSGKEF
jgi:hypothetical protein